MFKTNCYHNIKRFLFKSSTLCGKIVIQVIRLSAVLQCIENAFEIVLKNESFDKFKLSTELNDFLKNFIGQSDGKMTISRESLLRAQKPIASLKKKILPRLFNT